MHRLSRVRSHLSRPVTRYYSVQGADTHRVIAPDTAKSESLTEQDAPDERLWGVPVKDGKPIPMVASPKPRALNASHGSWSQHVTHLYQILRDHLTIPRTGSIVVPGYHQVSHKARVPESELCEDGADLKYSPGPEWKYRVWLGSTLEYSQLVNRRHRIPFMAKERFVGARFIGRPESDDAKAIVTIETAFDAHFEYRSPADVAKMGPGVGTNSLMETKRLCFLKKIPESLKSTDYSKDQIIPVPTNPLFEASMTPTPALLFRFSALTYNAHAVHLDTTYAREVYGIPKLLVQGPLTSVLMLEHLRQAIHVNKLGEGLLHVRSFTSRNRLPLWVNEKITLGCKKTRDVEAVPGGGAREEWEVWIAKGEGSNATLAVSGTALMEVLQAKSNKHDSRSISLDESDD